MNRLFLGLTERVCIGRFVMIVCLWPVPSWKSHLSLRCLIIPKETTRVRPWFCVLFSLGGYEQEFSIKSGQTALCFSKNTSKMSVSYYNKGLFPVYVYCGVLDSAEPPPLWWLHIGLPYQRVPTFVLIGRDRERRRAEYWQLNVYTQ